MGLQHAHDDAAGAGDEGLEEHQPHQAGRQGRLAGIEARRDGPDGLGGEDGRDDAQPRRGGVGELGVDMLAFSAVPVGPTHTQMTLFPADGEKLENVSRQAGLNVDGPHGALLVQGDDELGALAEGHGELRRAGIPVYASSGVSDGRGGYGDVIYVRAADEDEAATALGIE